MESLVNFVFVYALSKAGLVVIAVLIGMIYGAGGGTNPELQREPFFLVFKFLIILADIIVWIILGIWSYNLLF